METTLKNCLACGKPLKGRIDKKFCDDYCRNAFNNKLNSGGINHVRNINNALKKNRRILEELLHENVKMTRTNLEKLLQRGFQFKYFTHTYTNPRGNIYNFCYEYGYLPLESNSYLIVRQKESK